MHSTTDLKPLDTDLLWTLMGAEGEADAGGGEDGGAGDDGNSGDDGTDDDGDGDAQLGDAGKKALEAERASAKRAREAYKPWAAIKREFGLTPEQVRERLLAKPKTDEKDLDAARREAAAEASQKANTRILRAEIKGLAAKTFVDPADALAYLNLTDFEVDDDGDVDTVEVERALADLLKRKPHLGKPTGKKSGADFDGGARQSPPKKLGMNGLIRQSAGVNR